MKEAVALVKADFGQEAVILHTKRVRKGGLFGIFSRPKVEVIAATESRRRATPQTAVEIPWKSTAAGQTEPSPLSVHAASEISQVRAELEEIKLALQVNGSRIEEEFPAARIVRNRLLQQEVHEDFIQELLAVVKSRGTRDQLTDRNWVNQRIRSELVAGIDCADLKEIADKAKVQCLVGPTGVGKTTTIAKLAANFSLLGRKKVALITVDTYRIAAVEQLKTYAEIIGVPVDVAFTPKELKERIAARADWDMILIDTAGRSHRNKMQMQELRAFLDVMDNPCIHLVLSATTRFVDTLDIIERFGHLPFNYLILTKLDETSTYGMLYNAVRLTGKPLSYLTNGQNVPDDIELAEASKVAELILGVEP